MASESVILPAGFVAPGAPPQQMVRLTLGYVKGGIARIYEIKAKGIKNPGALVKKVREARIFNDVPTTPDWILKTVAKRGVFVVPTGTSKDAIHQVMTDIAAMLH